MTPCTLVQSDYQWEEKLLVLYNYSRQVHMKGWYVRTKPNGVTIQTTLILTRISFFQECLLEHAVQMTRKPHSLPPTCYIPEYCGRNKLKAEALVSGKNLAPQLDYIRHSNQLSAPTTKPHFP